MGNPAGIAIYPRSGSEKLKNNHRIWVLLASLAGLAAGIWAVGSVGLGEVLFVMGRIGFGGFALFCAYSLGTFLLLGGAWFAAAPGTVKAGIGHFCWARIVREAAADLLPFSQIGGLIIGARTLIARKLTATNVYASMIVDITTEMAAQLVFTLFGIAMFTLTLAASPQADALRPMILGGTGVMIALVAGFMLMQRHAFDLVGGLGERFLPGSIALMDGLRTQTRYIYAQPRRVLAALALNMTAWFASAAGAWIALRLMGLPVSFWSIITVESLIFTLRSVAFAIPGAIGVQEAAYVLIGPLLGLSPASALALSLAKRARDLAIGLPALLIWQGQEAKAVMAARA